MEEQVEVKHRKRGKVRNTSYEFVYYVSRLRKGFKGLNTSDWMPIGVFGTMNTARNSTGCDISRFVQQGDRDKEFIFYIQKQKQFGGIKYRFRRIPRSECDTAYSQIIIC